MTKQTKALYEAYRSYADALFRLPACYVRTPWQRFTPEAEAFFLCIDGSKACGGVSSLHWIQQTISGRVAKYTHTHQPNDPGRASTHKYTYLY